jgi:hypothetical protein
MTDPISYASQESVENFLRIFAIIVIILIGVFLTKRVKAPPGNKPGKGD